MIFKHMVYKNIMQKLNRILEKTSPRQAFYYMKARQPTEHLLHSLDMAALKKLLKYKDDTGHPQYKKYFNAAYWLRQNVQRALYLGLNRAQPQNILDIGAGFGYFPYVAKFYGHNVIGIDLPGDTLFNKASDYLNIDRRDHRIDSNTPMPSYGVKFDLITAFQICFNGHIEGEVWGEDEWAFFLNDLFENHVNAGGRVYLGLNWSPHIDGWIPEEVRALFKDKYHAKFDGPSRVILHAP